MTIDAPTPGQSTADILSCFQLVGRERDRRLAEPDLQACVIAVKAYQQARFRITYKDLLDSTRYGLAASFFLEELYGPRDFSARDAQFERVVPSLVKLFPEDIVQTVSYLAGLHALSEQLDTQMGQAVRSLQIEAVASVKGAGLKLDEPAYAAAWRATGHPELRQQQIEWTLTLGEDLDRLTRKPLIRHTLRFMRTPARAAGLGDLQQVLESGFEAFHAMRGAKEFLATVAERERQFADEQFKVPDGGIAG